MPVLGPDPPKVPTNHFLCEVGTVTVENMGLAGVTVMLSGMADGQTTTDDSGQFSFTGLRAGTYSVEISGFDTNEVSFSSTSGAATVGVGESKVVSFDGTYLRTAGIQGQVSVDGEGLGGVTVTLVGEGEERTDVTDAGGLYAFSALKSGTYQVAITNPDPEDYEFTTTSKSATVATGETANVPFEGTLLRTAGIAGRVSLDDGMGLDGVTVTLAGAAEATATTSNGGQYAFAGLAAGTYVLSIENPDANAYSFAEDEMMKTVMLEDDQSAIVNFSGTHTRTASVSGMLFVDEVMQDKMYTDGEPTIVAALGPWLGSLADDDPAKMAVLGALAKATVKLRGPDLSDEHDIPIMADGSFTTGPALMAGSYQVELPVNDDDVAAGLAAAGVAFVGESMVVNVEAGGNATVNFPFRITMQTVVTGARMGGGGHFGLPVEGVELALYARADGTDMLGEATTDEMGMATFNFARADNTGPVGNDNIVFVKAMDSGHPALHVSGNEFVEINHASTARLYAADAEKEVATLINVAVAFDFWVKSNEMARNGDEGLGGWSTEVYLGDPEDEDNMPLMLPNPMDPTMMVNATLPTDTTKGDDLGKSTFAYVADPTMVDYPVTFTVMAAMDDEADCKGSGLMAVSDQPDQCEMWEQSDALTHTHTGLDLPPGKDDDMLDLGPIRITYTTQTVYVGAHRELDDRTGFTDFIGVGDGDARPMGTGVDEIEVSLMVADSRGRLRAFEYDHDMDEDTEDVEATATVGASGMVSFAHIPADTEFTVVADAGSDMMIVPDDRSTREIDAFGDQLDDYPDGKMVGAFGDGSGARADVWICPLWRLDNDDPNENCSTFAYKWATGTISGDIDGLRKGDKASVILTPVNSNEDYEDDLADDDEITAGTGGAASYSFTGVADGRYMVTLEAKAGSWEEDETKVLSVMHDEESEDEEYTGATAGEDLSASDLRGVIRGRIANDSNGRAGLTSDESRAGVVVEIYSAKKVGGSGTTKNNYVPDEAVTDADGDEVMAETDGEGVFMFENLVVGDMYFLKPVETDLYISVRNGNTSIGKTAEKATDVVPHALVTAGLPPRAGTEPGIPTWDYHTSMATPNGDANFVLLYKDGEVEGKVSDPSVRAAHSRSVVELHLCRTSNQVLDTSVDPPTVTTAATGCGGGVNAYEGTVVEADVDEDGDWSADGLREGLYEVVPDLPAGYVVSDSAGTTDGTGTSYHAQQFVDLRGGRADDDTETIHIKDRNAGDGATLTSVEIDGTACTRGTATNPADNNCGHDAAGSFSVVATASTGAVVRLSSSATDATPTGTGTYSVVVSNGKATTVTLSKPGSRRFFVHVAAEDGYASNDATNEGFHVRRDADVRVKEVTIAWSGDRIELDRDALNLDPDGETDPVTGTTTLRVTVDKGDNNGDIPITDLTVTAMGMTTGFGVAGFGTVDVTTTPIACSAADFTGLSGDGTLTLPANTATDKGSDGVCFRIADTDGESDPDANADNNRDYILIVTRK